MGKSATKIIGMQWDFSLLWNEVLRSMPERAIQKRDYMYASELGGDFATRYLKMHAHKYTNPPTDRSRAKFAAGHIWEWIVGVILTLSGILQAQQLRGEVQLPGLLRVSGRLDFIAGGDVDWERAKAEVKRLREVFSMSVGDMPPIIFFGIDRIIKRMETMFSRVPLRKVVFECKSIGTFMAAGMEKGGKAMPHHVLQNLHYLIANKDITDGMLTYISKDDCKCYQFNITPSKPLLKIYKDDISKMTALYNGSGRDYLKNIPEKEPEVIFHESLFAFRKNFHAEYSPYLKFLYGYKDNEVFKEKWNSTLTSWNRVFRKCVQAGDLTPANKDVIKSAIKVFPEWDKYVLKAKIVGAFDKPNPIDKVA